MLDSTLVVALGEFGRTPKISTLSGQTHPGRDHWANAMSVLMAGGGIAGGQVYETVRGARSSDVRRLATYPERNILRSGWLLGEEAIANKAAIVAVEKGEGTILMLGFRVQHRAQTHGTYKLLFNALQAQPSDMSAIAAGGGD